MARSGITRRHFLGVGVAAVAVACADDSAIDDEFGLATTTNETTPAEATASSDPEEGPEPVSTELVAADFADLAICTLLPTAAAGPFGMEEQFVRRDLTEGRDGHPMRLGLRVVDSDCAPVAGAEVEIWHCDPTGDYSAFDDGGSGKDEGADTTFLRGTQTSDDDGIVEFATLYPGWYDGRAPHVHLHLRVAGERLLTAQLYFDDEYSDGIYAQAPYEGPADTSTAVDFLAGDVENDGTLLTLSPDPRGTLALANLGVRA